MKKFFVSTLAAMMTLNASAAKNPTAQLLFDDSKCVAGSVEMPKGRVNISFLLQPYCYFSLVTKSYAHRQNKKEMNIANDLYGANKY